MIPQLPHASHYMQLPREVLIGRDVASLVGETLNRLGFHGTALIVTGETVLSFAGGTVLDSLKKVNIGTETMTVQSSTTEEVARVEKKIQEMNPDIVVGFGGGKDIDVAKLGSMKAGKSFLSVPTTASHDGIASPLVSMKGLDRPYSYVAHAPIAIVADTSIIGKSPYRLIAAGCGDVVAKYTAVRDWKLAHRIKNEYYGDYAAELALMSSRVVMKNATSIRAMIDNGVRTLVEALISCGVAMSIAGSSRPCSGAEHLFSHALDIVAGETSLHGGRTGVGAIMCSYLQDSNWEAIREFLQEIGAPSTAKELKVSPEQVVKALTMAHSLRPERYTILGETGVTEAAAEKVARATGVIG